VSTEKETRSVQQDSPYDLRYGETDLLERELRQTRAPAIISFIAIMMAIVCGGFASFAAFRAIQQLTPTLTPSAMPATLQIEVMLTAGLPTPTLPVLLTNTPRPTVMLATVTPAPPTASFTPTQGPCEVVVQAGQTLTVLASLCGHQSMDVLPEILTLNDLDAPENIQIGQTIIIPRPTVEGVSQQIATVDPVLSGEQVTQIAALANETPILTNTPALRPSSTLLPGVQWHTVLPNDSMVGVMYQYSTTAEVLSQLNPEVPFSQCDFQFDTGGPRCTVFLQPGQMLRVPAPSPTPTLSPTLSGSETATPTFTPTFNAPVLISPDQRALFRREQIITLRWLGTASLMTGEVYVVSVQNLTTRQQYSATTTQLSFIVPAEWQGQDANRHEFEWTVSIAPADQPAQLRLTTAPRQFIWEGVLIPTPLPTATEE
jgi:LysM repeat protein